MKLALWKRALVGTLLTLSVGVPSLGTFAAGDALAAPFNDCTPANADCGVPRERN